ncbi:MAG: hypothetical protein GY714_18470 [Desulfobacterales bacterium]|nr:hypothetical protein [Desulfobacterales bacterium]
MKSSGYPYVNDKIKCAAPSANELQVCFQTEISSDWSNTAGTEASCPLNFFVKSINTSGSNTIGAWTDLTCCTWPYVKYDVEETFSPNWNYNNTFIGVADGQYINGFTRTNTSAKFQSLGDFHFQQSID